MQQSVYVIIKIFQSDGINEAFFPRKTTYHFGFNRSPKPAAAAAVTLAFLVLPGQKLS
jgi:hypothetical protein